MTNTKGTTKTEGGAGGNGSKGDTFPAARKEALRRAHRRERQQFRRSLHNDALDAVTAAFSSTGWVS